MSSKKKRLLPDGGSPADPKKHVLKVAGGDIELGNSVIGFRTHGNTCSLASQVLLREIDGVPANSNNSWSNNEQILSVFGGKSAKKTASGGMIDKLSSETGMTFNPQDRMRRFLPTNGGCAYIDLNHLELCLPEVTSASDHLAAAASSSHMVGVSRCGLMYNSCRFVPEPKKVQISSATDCSSRSIRAGLVRSPMQGPCSMSELSGYSGPHPTMHRWQNMSR